VHATYQHSKHSRQCPSPHDDDTLRRQCELVTNETYCCGCFQKNYLSSGLAAAEQLESAAIKAGILTKYKVMQALQWWVMTEKNPVQWSQSLYMSYLTSSQLDSM
jgi:hypothetical protein